MNAFFEAGIGIAVFILFLLLAKKNKAWSDWILTAWMALITVHLTLFYLYFTGDVFSLPFVLGFEQPLPLLHGVLLFLYVAYLTRQLPRNRATLLVHFLPALAMYAYLVPFLLLPADQKIAVYRSHGAGYELFRLVKINAIAISGICYVVWSELLLRRHARRIRDQFSDLENINLRWLQLLTYGLGAIWILVMVFHDDTLVFSGVVVFVFLIGFFGIRQTDIFVRGGLLEGDEEERKKYSKSGLTEEASGELHRNLLRLMAEEGLYRRSDLSITDLAARLNVHPNYLSQVINQKEQKNFYDFVNSYRIEEFKRLIAVPTNRQFTLLSLAHDCGFSSKSSFNRVFKKVTGSTPSQYVDSLQLA